MENQIKQQIRLLKMIDDCPPHDEIVAAREDPDWQFLMKWLRSGIIDGKCGTNSEGDVFLGPSLTDTGRELLRSLEEQTSSGFIRKNRVGVYKWFFCYVVGPIFVGFVIWLITSD